MIISSNSAPASFYLVHTCHNSNQVNHMIPHNSGTSYLNSLGVWAGEWWAINDLHTTPYPYGSNLVFVKFLHITWIDSLTWKLPDSYGPFITKHSKSVFHSSCHNSLSWHKANLAVRFVGSRGSRLMVPALEFCIIFPI